MVGTLVRGRGLDYVTDQYIHRIHIHKKVCGSSGRKKKMWDRRVGKRCGTEGVRVGLRQ